jgi:hypothetical protein
LAVSINSDFFLGKQDNSKRQAVDWRLAEHAA